MLGRLGTESLAAVGYATQFFMLAQSVLNAVGTVCVALMARAIGGGNLLRARRALVATLGLALGLATAIATPVFLAPEFLLRLLNASPVIVERAVPYLQLTLGSSLLLAISFSFESAFRAAKDTRTPMWIVGGVTVVKITLNAVLIFGLLGFPRLELVGAGIATVLSQVVAVGLFFWASRKGKHANALRLSRLDFRGAGSIFGEALRISVPAVGERVAMHIAILAYFAVLSQYGSIAIAAYTIGVRVLSFSWIPGSGFAVAAATLVGEALGASKPDQAARSGWRSVRFALIVSAVLGTLYAIGRVPVASIFSNDPVVVSALDPFMLLLALAQPLLALHFTLGGSLRGAGDTVSPFWASMVGNWVFRLPIALFFARVLSLDVVWVWGTLVLDHLTRAVWMVWVFQRGGWRRSSGVEILRRARPDSREA
jgi:putative MATE family efflux protein